MNTIFICLALISFSFIFSAGEIALFSLSRLQLKQIKDQSEVLFKKIRTLLNDSLGILITVLLFNEVLNIALGSILTQNYIEPLNMNWQFKLLFGVLLTTPITLIFCELTPKVIASRLNRAVLSLFLPVIYTFYYLTKPLVALIKIFLPKQQNKDLHQLHEDDFLILAEEHTETGHLHETELELIKNVFEMDDMRVEQIAVPLKKIFTIPSTYTIEQAAQTLLQEKIYSRVPIYGTSREDIVGVLHTKDLVEYRVDPQRGQESVMALAKEPLLVSGSITLDTLFRKMKAKKIQVAFVKNNLNKISGIITLQDILDMIIEEAFEE